MVRQYFQSTLNLILFCLLLVGVGLMAGWFILAPRVDASMQTLRGSIYDRNGKELASSHTAQSLYANPREVQDPDRLAKELAPLLNTPADMLSSRLKAQGSFVWLKRAMEPSEYKRIAEFIRSEEPRGLDFLTESRRVYPNDQLAGHVLGFVGIEEKGLAGIEMSMDATIKGRKLYITIDSAMQAAVEQALDNALIRTKAQAATMIVINPKTGEILAMANRPAYNPNAFFRYPENTWPNQAISGVFEPGSIFKALAAAAGIQEKVVTAKEVFNDAGFSDVVQQIGGNLMLRYAEAFGFGKATGIELPGEEGGLLLGLKTTQPSETAAMGTGRAVAVTPLQLLTAVSALANDGKLLKPQIIKEIRESDGQVVSKSTPQFIRQVVAPEVAQEMTGLLEKVLTESDGKRASVEGYRFAGQGGASERFKDDGSGYDPGRHINSFVGFGPLEDIQLAGLVVIDSPPDLNNGGEIAGPVFAEAMTQIVRIMGLTPSPDLK